MGGEITIKTGTTPGSPQAGNVTLWADADGTLQALQSSGSSSGLGMYSAYALFQDQKASTTVGGTFTQDAWRTRDINTEVSDTENIASVSSNQITLLAGTYLVRAAAPAYAASQHKARLYNITDSEVIAYGISMFSHPDGGVNNLSTVTAKFTITDTKVLEVQHYCRITKSSYGFGNPTEISGVIEVYTQIEFWKEA